MNCPDPAGLLGRWFADPLTEEQASVLLDLARQRRMALERRGRGCRICWLLELAALFWSGRETEQQYQLARQALGRTAHGRALLELLYGQLLMSRRLLPARQHLEQGFALARDLLTPEGYLKVLQRQQRLAALPLGARPHPAAGLPQLLTTAAVIERMGGVPRGSYPHDPADLYG